MWCFCGCLTSTLQHFLFGALTVTPPPPLSNPLQKVLFQFLFIFLFTWGTVWELRTNFPNISFGMQQQRSVDAFRKESFLWWLRLWFLLQTISGVHWELKEKLLCLPVITIGGCARNLKYREVKCCENWSLHTGISQIYIFWAWWSFNPHTDTQSMPITNVQHTY